MDIDEDDDEGFDETMEDANVEDITQSSNELAEHDVDETPGKQNVQSSSRVRVKTARTPAHHSKTPRTAKQSSQRAKKKKKKTRQSEAVDISALTNEQAVLAALESSHILHLKLRKRYYAEGLSFIRQIEGAMEIIGQLLGSKNKPEVLEAIEFFRVVQEYQFSTAEVGAPHPHFENFISYHSFHR